MLKAKLFLCLPLFFKKKKKGEQRNVVFQLHFIYTYSLPLSNKYSPIAKLNFICNMIFKPKHKVSIGMASKPAAPHTNISTSTVPFRN